MNEEEIIATVKVIAVVDDNATNREAAAKAIAEIMPSVTVRLYPSAEAIIAGLNKSKAQNIDLVLTDMNMEDRDSGYQVACNAWAWNIPAVIVSGGHKTHTTDQVFVGYPSGEYYGDKDDSNIWSQIIKHVLAPPTQSNAILIALKHGKKEQPDYEYGEVCAGVMIGKMG